MEGQTLRDYEMACQTAAQEQYAKAMAAQAAQEKSAAANAAYNTAFNEMVNACDYYSAADEAVTKAYHEALKAKESAKNEFDTAVQEFEAAAEAANEAAEKLEAKKEELRKAARTDTSFVVHTARVECNYGTENTFLALALDHGVTTKGFPQMLVSDHGVGENIFKFYGCTSIDNPEVQKAAEAAVENARKQVEESEDFRDKIMNAIFGKEEIEVTESVREKVIGKCICKLPANVDWEKGQENMEINGIKPMLRRCKLKCIYGGTIIVLLSGQPE